MIYIKAIFIFYLLELGSLTTNNQITIYKKMFKNVKRKRLFGRFKYYDLYMKYRSTVRYQCAGWNMA